MFDSFVQLLPRYRMAASKEAFFHIIHGQRNRPNLQVLAAKRLQAGM